MNKVLMLLLVGVPRAALACDAGPLVTSPPRFTYHVKIGARARAVVTTDLEHADRTNLIRQSPHLWQTARTLAPLFGGVVRIPTVYVVNARPGDEVTGHLTEVHLRRAIGHDVMHVVRHDRITVREALAAQTALIERALEPATLVTRRPRQPSVHFSVYLPDALRTASPKPLAPIAMHMELSWLFADQPAVEAALRELAPGDRYEARSRAELHPGGSLRRSPSSFVFFKTGPRAVHLTGYIPAVERE